MAALSLLFKIVQANYQFFRGYHDNTQPRQLVVKFENTSVHGYELVSTSTIVRSQMIQISPIWIITPLWFP